MRTSNPSTKHLEVQTECTAHEINIFDFKNAIFQVLAMKSSFQILRLIPRTHTHKDGVPELVNPR